MVDHGLLVKNNSTVNIEYKILSPALQIIVDITVKMSSYNPLFITLIVFPHIVCLPISFLSRHGWVFTQCSCSVRLPTRCVWLYIYYSELLNILLLLFPDWSLQIGGHQRGCVVWNTTHITAALVSRRSVTYYSCLYQYTTTTRLCFCRYLFYHHTS